MSVAEWACLSVPLTSVSAPLDLLDKAATAGAVGTDRALMARRAKNQKEKEAKESEDVKMDEEGKIVIEVSCRDSLIFSAFSFITTNSLAQEESDTDEDKGSSSDDDSDMDTGKKRKAGGKRDKKSGKEQSTLARAKAKAAARKLKQRKGEWKYSGSAYKSKKVRLLTIIITAQSFPLSCFTPFASYAL